MDCKVVPANLGHHGFGILAEYTRRVFVIEIARDEVHVGQHMCAVTEKYADWFPVASFLRFACWPLEAVCRISSVISLKFCFNGHFLFNKWHERN